MGRYCKLSSVISAFISLKNLLNVMSSTNLRLRSRIASGFIWLSLPFSSNAIIPSFIFCRIVSILLFSVSAFSECSRFDSDRYSNASVSSPISSRVVEGDNADASPSARRFACAERRLRGAVTFFDITRPRIIINITETGISIINDMITCLISSFCCVIGSRIYTTKRTLSSYFKGSAYSMDLPVMRFSLASFPRKP